MVRPKLPDTPIPQGPFIGGINRTIDRVLAKNSLWDAQGAIQVERGRWRSCWEGTAAEATFGPLTSSWTTWAANTAYSLDALRVPTTANGYLYMCVTAGTSHASTEPTWVTVIGATVSDGTVTWKCVAIDSDKSPNAMVYWRNNETLVAANDYKMALESGSVPLITPSRESGRLSFVEYDGFLVVCRDKEPMKIFPASSLTSSTMFNTAKINGEHWEGFCYGGGTPIVPYFTYFDVVCTVDSTATANYLAATGVSGANGAHGSGINMDTANDEYVTLAIRYKTDAVNFANANIARGGLAISDLAGSGTANQIYAEIGATITVLANFYESYRVRFGNNMQQVMGRFPAVYRNRLCIVEGREYDYSLLNHGSANTVTNNVGSYSEINGDYTDDVAVGDDLILFNNLGRASTLKTASVTQNSVTVTLSSNDTWYYYDRVGIQADDGTVGYYYADNDTSGGASTTLVLTSAYTGSTDATVSLWLNPGDDAITTPSQVKDYILSRRNCKILPIVGIAYNIGGTGDTRFQHSTSANKDISSSSTTAKFWATRRRLTAEQRRTIYFAGREADTANSIGADATDLSTWDTDASIIVGVASDGDITALFAQSDDRLLVCLESAIYQITGQPPLGSVIPADFTTNPPKIASVGVQNNDCIVSDSSGQVIYFATPQGQIMRLYGQTISSPPISSPVESMAQWPTKFRQLQFVDNRLYCMEDADDPYIWIYDTLAAAGQEWSYTARINSGQDQTGTAKALEISDNGYGGKVSASSSSVTANSKSVTLGSAKTWRKRSPVYITDDSSVVRRYLAANAGSSATALTLDRPYEGSTDSTVTVDIYPGNRLYTSAEHGGIFAPYKNVDGDPDRLLVSYTQSSDYKVRTLNYRPDEHNYANLCHGVRLQTGYETAGVRNVNKVVRTVSVVDTKPMLASSSTLTAVTELRIDVSNSEGDTILSRNIDPDDTTADANYYECQGSGGVGDTAVSIGVGDGISALPGEFAECQILFRTKGRYR